MGNKKTPLLQKLRNVGGTLYVFPSATEDIGLNLQSTTTGVAMSHFALLNIPELNISDCIKECAHSISAANGNEALAMSLQNYAMNLETHLINEPTYNYQKLETISEKVFWKWAEHIGIFDPIRDISNGLTGNPDIYFDKRYNEDESVATQDNTLIKCFGAIDAGNQLSTEFGMFNETYINIPTSWGSGPVYLKRSDSDNFKLGNEYPVSSPDHLEGRDDENAYYSYTNSQDYPFFDVIEVDNDQYKYVINPLKDGFEILKDINQIQTVSRNVFNNDEILFDSYDDINIDSENNLNIDQEFQFNTILLYYSVYDQDDLIKTPYAINLFGVIFLDGATSGTNFVIPPITKRKSTTTQFGNSYSFRVNLKTMSVYDNTDAIIQDNTTLSSIHSVEFSDVISNMNRAIDIMNSNLTTTMAIQDQYAAILNYYDNFEDDLHDISTCLNSYLKGTRSSFVDTSVVYTNEIRTTKSENNQLLIKTHSDITDINGNIIYNDPVISIKDSSVIIPSLENTKMWTKQSYVIVNTNDNKDINILNPPVNNVFVNNCLHTLDKAFDTSEGFIIKLKIEDSSIHQEECYNELYIAPESPIFNVNSTDNLRYLLDGNNNINYTAIIPYLIAEVIKLKQLLKDASIYQDLDN